MPKSASSHQLKVSPTTANLSGIVGWIVLAIVLLFTHAGSLSNGFVYDDDLAIIENPLVQNAAYADAWTEDIWGTSGPVTTGTYRPLMVISFIAQWQIWPGNPLPFHLVNLILLIIVGGLALHLFSRWLPSGWALLGAAIVVLHPANSEVTFSIVQRSELLAAIGTIGYILVIVPRGGENHRNGLQRSILAVLLLALGLFSKESSLMAPFLALVIDRFRPDGVDNTRAVLRRHAVPLIGASILIAAYFTLRLNALGDVSRDVPFEFNPTVALPLVWRHLNTAWLTLNYLARFLWPAPVPMEWVYNQLPILKPEDWPSMLLVWITGLAIILLMMRGLRKHSLAALGIAWFGITIALVVQAFVTVTVLFADRCLFLPSIGLTLTVLAILRSIPKISSFSSRSLRLAGLAIILFLASHQIVNGHAWKDNASFFKTLAANSPDCANARLGNGKFQYSGGLLDVAKSELAAASKIAPFSPTIYHWQGIVALDRGEFGTAVKSWQKVKEKAHPVDYPSWQKEHSDKLTVFGSQFLFLNPAAAINPCKIAAEILQTNFNAWHCGSIAQALLKRSEGLENHLTEMEKSGLPKKQVDLSRAVSFQLLGDLDEAIEAMKNVVKENPEDISANYGLALLLAETGEVSKAIEIATRLLKSNPDNNVLASFLDRISKK